MLQQVCRCRGVAGGQGPLQGSGRRDEFGCGLCGDLGVFEVAREVRVWRAELRVQLLVVGAGVPIVDPADDLAVAEVDRCEGVIGAVGGGITPIA